MPDRVVESVPGRPEPCWRVARPARWAPPTSTGSTHPASHTKNGPLGLRTQGSRLSLTGYESYLEFETPLRRHASPARVDSLRLSFSSTSSRDARRPGLSSGSPPTAPIGNDPKAHSLAPLTGEVTPGHSHRQKTVDRCPVAEPSIDHPVALIGELEGSPLRRSTMLDVVVGDGTRPCGRVPSSFGPSVNVCRDDQAARGHELPDASRQPVPLHRNGVRPGTDALLKERE